MNSSVRATFWSGTQFALKTYPEQRALAEQRGWKVDGQEETCPTTGRKHYQFWVKTPQVRRSAVTDVFQGAHIEPAKNEKALKNYCQKEETRSGPLPKASDKYPSQDKLFDLFVRWLWRVLSNDKRQRFPKTGDDWLARFDQCVDTLIRDGYRVESLAVNPAVRSCIKKYGDAIYDRHISAKFAEEDENGCAGDRQTDRQAEIFSQHVVIPTIDASLCSGDDTEEGSASNSESSAGENLEDDFSSASSGHTQSTDADSGEAGDSSCDSE